MPDLPIFTGTQVNYFAVCHRKLWLFSRGVEMEREDENVQIGKLIGEQSYSRKQKEIAIDDRVVIDWVESTVGAGGVLTLHEVKKSRAVEEAHRLQMLYYIFYLRCKGVTARGEIDYPLLKKKEQVELTPQAEAELLCVLDELEQIVESKSTPPRLAAKRFCEKCAYEELCWS